MANDIDVKIGITTQGDTSGADNVDKSLDEVKRSAEEAAKASGDAAAKAASDVASAADAASNAADKLRDSLDTPIDGGLADSIGDVDQAATSLSDNKKKAGLAGLSRSLEGLAKGDIPGAISGLSEGLYQLADAIPLPAAGIALGLAGFAISGVFKAIKAASGEAAESLRNDFGETLDEEMERLESWALSELEWTGIKEANANIIKDFDSVVSAAAATQKAIDLIFSANIASQLTGLEAERKAAAESGDAQREKDIATKIEQVKQFEEMVKLNVEIVEQKAKLEEMKISIDEQAAAANATREAAEAGIKELETLRETITAISGNSDATRPGSVAHTELVNNLRGRSDAAGEDAARLSKIKGYEDLAAARRIEEDSLRKLADEIALLNEKMNLAADQEDALKTAREESNETARQSALEYTTLQAEIAALETKLKDLSKAAGPDVAGQAAEQAAYMTEQATSTLENMEALVVENSERIKSAGQAAFDGAKTAAGNLDEARSAYETSARQMGEATGKIKKAAEAVGNESEAAGEEIKEFGRDFRVKIGDMMIDFSGAVTDLSNTSRSIGRMGADLAAEQRRIAQEVASLRHQTNAAQADAALALSQVRNSR